MLYLRWISGSLFRSVVIWLNEGCVGMVVPFFYLFSDSVSAISLSQLFFGPANDGFKRYVVWWTDYYI